MNPSRHSCEPDGLDKTFERVLRSEDEADAHAFYLCLPDCLTAFPVAKLPAWRLAVFPAFLIARPIAETVCLAVFIAEYHLARSCHLLLASLLKSLIPLDTKSIRLARHAESISTE